MEERSYDVGMRPRVFINWQSFVAQGIPDDWRLPFQDAVINAYTRWMTMAGVDMRFQFWDYTDKTLAADGELVISMNRFHSVGESRVASTFWGHNQAVIVFHRRSGDDVTIWPFVPYNAMPGEIDMQAVLMHEFGHAHGLEHSASSEDTMFGDYGYQQRYGPFDHDVKAVKSLYPDFSKNRIRQMRSGDGAGSWAAQPNNLTSYENPDARTTLTPGSTQIGGTDNYVVGWSIPSRVPTWLRGDGATFLFDDWTAFGLETSVHGPAFASDDSGFMLWAWAHNDDAGSLRMIASEDKGQNWFGTGSTPPGATTAGMPALCWTRLNGQSTWICVWVNFERNSPERTGLIQWSISTDNGWTWSTPASLHPTFKALSGVSAAANMANSVVVGFALAPTGTTVDMNRVQIISCQIANGQLERLHAESLTAPTRHQPALAFDASHNRFILAIREQNFLTTLATLWKGPAASDPWTGRVMLDDRRSNTPPALAASPRRKEIRLFYGYED